jgi:L-lactate dehydrogenase complex protein LldG
LSKVRNNQPEAYPLPPIPVFQSGDDKTQQFENVLKSIGGDVLTVDSEHAIDTYLESRFGVELRRVRLTPGSPSGHRPLTQDPHFLEDVGLAVLPAHFGVAENGAVWITESLMGDRALPFICEHLVLVLPIEEIVPNMHDAYDRIGYKDYKLGTFIAGPSKTADIEQSLVLGAHGPKSLTVILVNKEPEKNSSRSY